jgi:hypothetical protein
MERGAAEEPLPEMVVLTLDQDYNQVLPLL